MTSEAELREALRVAAIEHDCTVTFVEDMKVRPVEWRRIPRDYRDQLERLAAGSKVSAARIRALLQ